MNGYFGLKNDIKKSSKEKFSLDLEGGIFTGKGFLKINKTPEEGSIYVLAGVYKVRFIKRVRPGDNLDLYSKVVGEKRGIWKFDCKAELNNELVCSATILCADRKA